MDEHIFEEARINWITRQREIYKAQLNLLNGGPANPFDGASDHLIFANTAQARRTLEGWISEIETMLGLSFANGA